MLEENTASDQILEEKSNPPEIENLQLFELLGKGGSSSVYKARQVKLDRIVAVKVVSAGKMGEEAVSRFQKEAKLSSKLKHPNIVSTLSFGLSQEGLPYLVLEYLEGLTLAEELQQKGRLSLHRFKDIFLPLLSALEHAHSQGLIHRDIQPANIMLSIGSDGKEIVKLVDFGIAKMFGEAHSQTYNLKQAGLQVGTPAYMSPEQCLGQAVDARSDLYSLACVMYQSLTGNLLFTASSQLELMDLQRTSPAPTAADLCKKIELPTELAIAIVSALSKDPTQRPQTAVELSAKIINGLDRITTDRLPRLKAETNNPVKRTAVAVCAVLAVLLLAALQRSVKENAPNSNELKQETNMLVPDIELARKHVAESERLLALGSFSKTAAEANRAIERLGQASKDSSLQISKENLLLLERLVPVYAKLHSTANERIQRKLEAIVDKSKLDGESYSRLLLAAARIQYYCENVFDSTIVFLRAFHSLYAARSFEKCRDLVGELRSLTPSGDRARILNSIAVHLCQGFMSTEKGNVEEANKSCKAAHELIERNLSDDSLQHFEILRFLFRLEQMQPDLHSARKTARVIEKIAEQCSPYLYEIGGSPYDKELWVLECLLKDSRIEDLNKELNQRLSKIREKKSKFLEAN